MAYKESNLYITEECYFDANTRKLYGPEKPDGERIGKQLAIILEHFLRNPNIYMTVGQFVDVLSVKVPSRAEKNDEEEAFKKQITRLKSALVSATGTDDVKALITSTEEKWAYHQPKELLSYKPAPIPTHTVSTEKKYLAPDLPRLMSQYEAERTKLENEIINRFVLHQDSVLFITGEAGIGKSELAISVGRKLAKHYHVARLTYDGTLYNTIMELYPEISGVNERTTFDKKISAFVHAYDGQFVIIDNFYDPSKSFREMRSEETFRILLSSNINLILVTRYQDTGEFSSCAVPPLSMKQQISLMRGNGLQQYSDSQLRELCKLVGGNTLLCDLIGKLLRNPYNPKTYEEIKGLLTTNSLSSSSLNVYSEKDRESIEGPVYQHLKNLCGDIMVSEKEKSVLSAASLLPTDGMSIQAFCQFCGIDGNMLASLHSKGLISTNDSQKVLLHALYTLYYRDSSSGSDICKADVTGFIDSLCEYFNSGNLSDHDLNTSICTTLKNVYQSETDINYKAKIGLFLASFLGLSGRYTEAYEIEKECIEKPDLLDQELLGKLYKDIAISAGRFDKDEETVSYLEKAVEILKQSDNPVAYLQSVNSLAYAYGKAGDHEKQKAIAKEALESNDYSDYQDNYVRLLNNLADSEYRLGEYEAAEEHIKEAISIYDNLQGAPIIWTIQAKRLYGNILFCEGKKEEAIQMVKAVLDKANENLEDDHLEIIRLNSCLGDMLDPEPSKVYYAEAVKLAIKNPIAGERLRTALEGGHRYLVFISEGGTMFMIETDDGIDTVSLEDTETCAKRVIVYSLEEQKKTDI